jgi:hypothetical protein
MHEQLRDALVVMTGTKNHCAQPYRLRVVRTVDLANLSTAARQTPSFLRAAVAVSSTTCFGDFQPAKTIGFYRPRFSELE